MNAYDEEAKIAIFMRSIAETVRQSPRGIPEKELLGEYLRRERVYVTQALERAKRERVVICRDNRLHRAGQAWSLKQDSYS